MTIHKVATPKSADPSSFRCSLAQIWTEECFGNPPGTRHAPMPLGMFADHPFRGPHLAFAIYTASQL